MRVRSLLPSWPALAMGARDGHSKPVSFFRSYVVPIRHNWATRHDEDRQSSVEANPKRGWTDAERVRRLQQLNQ